MDNRNLIMTLNEEENNEISIIMNNNTESDEGCSSDSRRFASNENSMDYSIPLKSRRAIIVDHLPPYKSISNSSEETLQNHMTRKTYGKRSSHNLNQSGAKKKRYPSSNADNNLRIESVVSLSGEDTFSIVQSESSGASQHQSAQEPDDYCKQLEKENKQLKVMLLRFKLEAQEIQKIMHGWMLMFSEIKSDDNPEKDEPLPSPDPIAEEPTIDFQVYSQKECPSTPIDVIPEIFIETEYSEKEGKGHTACIDMIRTNDLQEYHSSNSTIAASAMQRLNEAVAKRQNSKRTLTKRLYISRLDPVHEKQPVAERGLQDVATRGFTKVFLPKDRKVVQIVEQPQKQISTQSETPKLNDDKSKSIAFPKLPIYTVRDFIKFEMGLINKEKFQFIHDHLSKLCETDKNELRDFSVVTIIHRIINPTTLRFFEWNTEFSADGRKRLKMLNFPMFMSLCLSLTVKFFGENKDNDTIKSVCFQRLNKMIQYANGIKSTISVKKKQSNPQALNTDKPSPDLEKNSLPAAIDIDPEQFCETETYLESANESSDDDIQDVTPKPPQIDLSE